MDVKKSTEPPLQRFERRGSPRIKVKLPIKYRLMRRTESRAGLSRDETYEHGSLADVSASGMCIEVAERLQAGQLVEVYVPPTSSAAEDGARAWLSIVAVVRAERAPDKWKAGVHFEDRSNLS